MSLKVSLKGTLKALTFTLMRSFDNSFILAYGCALKLVACVLLISKTIMYKHEDL